MAKRFYINDSVLNPVNDGVFETGVQQVEFETGVFIIAFYDAQGEPVTPTAGTVKPEMSPVKGQYLEPSSGDITIDATTAGDGSASYKMPVFIGPAIGGRIELDGIVGAEQYTAYFWRT